MDITIVGNDDSVWITANGNLEQKSRFISHIYCSMNVNDFPFDKQNCTWYETSMKYLSQHIQITGNTTIANSLDDHPGKLELNPTITPLNILQNGKRIRLKRF